jgi:hypothetical protein
MATDTFDLIVDGWRASQPWMKPTKLASESNRRDSLASATGEVAWLASYPELCATHNISVNRMPSLSLWSYQLNCEVCPSTIDYANPVVIADTWKYTAGKYLPNLTLRAACLGRFLSPTRMLVCR